MGDRTTPIRERDSLKSVEYDLMLTTAATDVVPRGCDSSPVASPVAHTMAERRGERVSGRGFSREVFLRWGTATVGSAALFGRLFGLTPAAYASGCDAYIFSCPITEYGIGPCSTWWSETNPMNDCVEYCICMCNWGPGNCDPMSFFATGIGVGNEVQCCCVDC